MPRRRMPPGEKKPILKPKIDAAFKARVHQIVQENIRETRFNARQAAEHLIASQRAHEHPQFGLLVLDSLPTDIAIRLVRELALKEKGN